MKFLFSGETHPWGPGVGLLANMQQRRWLICSLINLRWMKKKQKRGEAMTSTEITICSAFELWKSLPPSPSELNPLSIKLNRTNPTLTYKYYMQLKKAFQRCEEIFLLNDFMPPVMTWKQFSSSLQPTCDWYRNNVRNAEAFMKSRLLFLEMIAQKSLKKL